MDGPGGASSFSDISLKTVHHPHKHAGRLLPMDPRAKINPGTCFPWPIHLKLVVTLKNQDTSHQISCFFWRNGNFPTWEHLAGLSSTIFIIWGHTLYLVLCATPSAPRRLGWRPPILALVTSLSPNQQHLPWGPWWCVFLAESILIHQSESSDADFRKRRGPIWQFLKKWKIINTKAYNSPVYTPKNWKKNL